MISYYVTIIKYPNIITFYELSIMPGKL